MKSRLTSNQPEVGRTKVYGSSPVVPLAGASNQPQVIPTKVHGVKKTRQIRVRLKADKTKREFLVPFDAFDPVKHARVD